MGIFSQEDFDEILCEAVKRGRYDVVRLLLGSNIQFSLEIVKKAHEYTNKKGPYGTPTNSISHYLQWYIGKLKETGKNGVWANEMRLKLNIFKLRE